MSEIAEAVRNAGWAEYQQQRLSQLTERMTVDYAEGVAMTEKIMQAVAPIVDGQPSDLVIEAFAAAMMGVLAASKADVRQARLVMHHYAERILDFAAGGKHVA